MNVARWAIALASGGLILIVLIGFALSGTWTATAEARIEASPEAVWPLVADLRRWDDWAPLGQVESDFSPRTVGQGARRSWDSEDWGSGEVTVTSDHEPDSLTYRVRVQEGTIVTDGTLRLDPTPDGATTVTWTERGDFGWNPFLAFIALRMHRTQGAVLAQSLDSLGAVARRQPAPVMPADTTMAADSASAILP